MMKKFNIPADVRCAVCAIVNNKPPASCPINVCDKIALEVKANHRNAGSIMWSNSATHDWTSKPWAVTKLYMSVGREAANDSAIHTDCSGLLRLMLNSRRFAEKLGVELLKELYKVCHRMLLGIIRKIPWQAC
jgi:hypothetical protein